MAIVSKVEGCVKGTPPYVTATAAMKKMIMTIFVFVWIIDIHVELQVPLLSLLDFIGHRVDVLEIRLEDSALVGLSDLQHEAPATVLFDVVAVGPGYYGTEIVVLDGLVGVEAENDVVGLLAGDEVREVGIFEGRQGIEVK